MEMRDRINLANQLTIKRMTFLIINIITYVGGPKDNFTIFRKITSSEEFKSVSELQTRRMMQSQGYQ